MPRSILGEAEIHAAVRAKAGLAYKMWTGWPTLPMVFVKGVLVGGASDLKRLLESGELKRGK